MKRVNVGLVLYNNSQEEIFQCLNSLNRQTSVESINKLLIKDNSISPLEHVDHWITTQTVNFEIQQWYGTNNGFGASHNFLFQHSTEAIEAYLCLNPDGVMHPNCLKALLEKMDQKGPNNLFEARQEPVMHPKFYHPDSGVTDWCSGACLLIPSHLYRTTQGFDETFFLYCEDVDLSWRVRAQGGRCFSISEARFLHYTLDRKQSSSDVEIWKSAAILAHKWCSKNFVKQALDRVKSLDRSELNSVQETLKKIKQVPCESLKTVKPHFNSGLVFSDALWN